VVRRLNAAFETHPVASIACLLTSEMASIYGAHALLLAAHADIPASFAVAFALSRTLRRARLPAELALAAGLARLVPALRAVRVTALLNALPAPRAATSAQLTTSRWGRWLGRAGSAARATVDRYGAAYFVAARYLGVGIVLTLYGALGTGIDVAAYLERLGASPALGTTLGTWAAAVTMSSAVYPATVVLAGLAAPAVGRTGTALLRRVRPPSPSA